MTTKLKRQQEAVDRQGFKVDNLRRKLLDLESGDVKSNTLAGLERQLKAAEELAAMDRQMQPLLDRLSALDNEREEGLRKYRAELEKLREVAAIKGERESLLNQAKNLKTVKLGSVNASEIKNAKLQMKQLGAEIAE